MEVCEMVQSPRIAQNLSFNQKVDVLKWAYANCYDWWVDKLDCRVSFMRQKTDMSFDEVMYHFTQQSFFSIAYREAQGFADKEHIEIGFRTDCLTDSDIEYFLWIKLDMNFLHCLL